MKTNEQSNIFVTNQHVHNMNLLNSLNYHKGEKDHDKAIIIQIRKVFKKRKKSKIFNKTIALFLLLLISFNRTSKSFPLLRLNKKFKQVLIYCLATYFAE